MSAAATLSLCFDSARAHLGRRVRDSRFVRKSALPMSAACLVANAIRETLAALLQRQIRVRLTEPVVPDAGEWDAMAAESLLFRVRGAQCDAVVILRIDDALALVAAAFGEDEYRGRSISRIEAEMLERIVRSLSSCFTPLCGPAPVSIERILDISGFASYFALFADAGPTFRIGVALSRDPEVPPVPGLRLEDLGGVEVELTAVLAQGLLPAGDVVNLRPGTLVPMMTRMGEPGLLKLGPAVLARGDCGTIGERNALVVVAPAR